MPEDVPTRAFRVAEDAEVSAEARVGAGSVIWGGAVVREGARLGDQCVVGRLAYIDHDVVIGSRCKIQNNALLYAPARLRDGVFIGPGVILTNDPVPRAVNPDGSLKGFSDWQPAGVFIEEGASIGAGAVVLGGVRIGSWAMVGAGAVVTYDVPPFGLVVGVPARRVGWVGRSGKRLEAHGAGAFVDSLTGDQYVEAGGFLKVKS